MGDHCPQSDSDFWFSVGLHTSALIQKFPTRLKRIQKFFQRSIKELPHFSWLYIGISGTSHVSHIVPTAIATPQFQAVKKISAEVRLCLLKKQTLRPVRIISVFNFSIVFIERVQVFFVGGMKKVEMEWLTCYSRFFVKLHDILMIYLLDLISSLLIGITSSMVIFLDVLGDLSLYINCIGSLI